MTGYESKKAMAQAKLDSMEREALKLALEENISNARAVLKNMHITSIRVLAESMDRDTTGLTTSEVKALLMEMAYNCDWMPNAPRTEAAHDIKKNT